MLNFFLIGNFSAFTNAQASIQYAYLYIRRQLSINGSISLYWFIYEWELYFISRYYKNFGKFQQQVKIVRENSKKLVVFRLKTYYLFWNLEVLDRSKGIQLL